MNPEALTALFDQRSHCCLYHACTVTTFQSYCAIGAYVSRAAVQASGLRLTPQFSDPTDVRLGIFDHLFLNVYDQHGDHSGEKSVFGINKYGPVLMVFAAQAVEHATEWRSYRLEVTDPSYRPDDHEIVDMQDFVNETFRYTVDYAFTDEPSRRPGTRGPASCLFTRDPGGGIPLREYLREVVLDRLPPKFKELEEQALNDVRGALAEAGSDAEVRMRKCVRRCGCRPGYEAMEEAQVRRFFYEDTVEVYSMKLPRFAPE